MRGPEIDALRSARREAATVLTDKFHSVLARQPTIGALNCFGVHVAVAQSPLQRLPPDDRLDSGTYGEHDAEHGDGHLTGSVADGEPAVYCGIQEPLQKSATGKSLRQPPNRERSVL